MTTNDVSAAAERLRAFKAHPSYPHSGRHYTAMQEERDKRILADAYLKFLDPTPLTPEILRIKFGWNPNQILKAMELLLCAGRLKLTWWESDGLITITDESDGGLDDVHLPTSTVGQLAHLLAALVIDAAEGA